ncbi:hypothetical protein CW740_08725 [Kangiella profundi]|uniref:Uncharacterized protein n=1 Tax=Kangiella profundi TaxID=1561924 RepID=A0A2K9AK52_9GAMM|nr:S8 family peptidase [Kangiella profundi]AUD79324.1 hypothetical protein CW740_08725 [Kangiella profundi]GGE99542.1 hypothetical protein GCM10011356_11600 [Kangiella profundi]
MENPINLPSRLNRLDIKYPRTFTIKDVVLNPKDTGKPREESFSGFVIVRLSKDFAVADDSQCDLMKFAKSHNAKGLLKILDSYNLESSVPVIKGTKRSRILEMEKAAMKSELPPINSLTQYWRLDLRDQPELVRELIGRLNELPEVDLAYRELSVSDPLVDASDDPYNGTQNYQDAAPDGIDARWAWTQANGEGAGVGFVDLEQGWFLAHEDYAVKLPTLLYGDNRDGIGGYVGNHGTAVLGEVVAEDNALGVVGIAPSCTSVNVTSHYDDATSTALHVADAIIGALPSMDAGDVLLLEVQRGGAIATEVDDADFDAIRLATATGVIVVEAAGNGSNNLDTYTNGSGDNILNRTSPDFRESGAIIVGAASSAVPHERLNFSSFGTRVDCFAWGQNVTTCGYGALDDGGGDNDKTYTNAFNGTSSASPIVAGAAVVLQGMYEANSGTRLSPLQMRALLSDPATNTPQGVVTPGNIGVMPDLRGIIENTLGIVPDVYVRDAVTDDGSIPFAGGISASPDIITRKATVADPNASFGQGSGNENSNTLGYEVESGQDNFIYVRMKNRGGGDANNVTATIYWSEVSTLVTPDMWNLIGTTSPINVPAGDVLRVADPLTWASADIPATGHYCYVGILEHAQDPAPPLPPATDWNGFRDFIRNHNNVTWRNFNVVDLDPSVGADPEVLPFMIAGAPDKARIFNLEILQSLAKGNQVWLEVPMELGKAFLEGRQLKYEIDREKKVVRMLLPSIPRLLIPEVRLNQRGRYRCHFIIKGVKKNVEEGNKLAIRQIYDEQEMGRVSWVFHDRRLDEKPCD